MADTSHLAMRGEDLTACRGEAFPFPSFREGQTGGGGGVQSQQPSSSSWLQWTGGPRPSALTEKRRPPGPKARVCHTANIAGGSTLSYSTTGLNT